MRKSPSNRGSRTGAILAMATGSLLACGLQAEGGTSYSYVGTTSGSWSNPANWSPSSSYPQTGDTGNLGDATANRTVIYDTGASGALGTLTFAQTDPFENQLDVQKSLTITSPVTLSSAAGGTADFLEDAALGTAASPGTATTTFSGGLTINSGGVLEIQDGANTVSAQQSNIAGTTTVNGGVFSIDQAVASSAGGSAVETSGTLTVNSGSVEFGVIGPAGLSASLVGVNSGTYAVNKFVALGNLSIATGSSVLLGKNTTVSSSDLWSSASISIGTLATGSVVPTVGLVGGGTNTLTSDATIAGGLYLRPLYDTVPGANYGLINDTIGSLTGTLLTLGSSGTGSPGSAIQYISGTTGGTISITLSSNVTTSNLPISGTLASNATSGSFVLDTKGKTMNLGTAAETLANVNIEWTLTSSAAGGQFDAATFNLSQGASGGGSKVGPNLNLVATGGNSTANVLSNTNNLLIGSPAAPGTIDPTSTFTYAGTAVVATPATLASSRTIGNLAVTSGALQLASSITTGTSSSTTVALNATLDTGNNTLTTTNLTVNGTLSGTAANSSVSLSGMLAGTGTVGATSGITITSTGGLSPAGAGTVGTLSIASNTSALTLSASGTSNFDLASDSSFDTVKLNGVTVNYAGTLNANFSYAPNVGTTNYAIFSGLGTETGNFTVTSNLPSATDTVTFNPASGMLTVVATPEPASAMTLGIFSLGLLARRRRRRA